MTSDLEPAAQRARRWARRVAGAAVLLFAGCLVWTGVVLHQVQSDLDDVRASADVASMGDDTSLAEVRATLETSRSDLGRAVGRLRQPGPRLVGALPFAGRVVDGPTAVAEAGLAVVGSVAEVLEVVDDGQILVDGVVQLQRVAQVQQALALGAERSQKPVRNLVDVEVAGMPRRLQHGVREARAALVPAAGYMKSAADALAALHGVLGGSGDRRLAVVLLNNAEQRGLGGVVSVFAVGSAREGRLELDSFQDVFDVADPRADARRVPSPADYHALWGRYLADTTLWRNVAMSPDGPSTLGVASGVVAATTGVSPDVVIALDVRAIAAALRGTGPVPLPGGTLLTADNAVKQLLLDAYTRFPDDARGQTLRRRVLRGAADGVTAAVLRGEADGPKLVSALADAAAGRHLVLWSRRPAEQQLLEASGLAGQLQARGGDLASVATQNFGQSPDEGNKLDYFARRLHQVDVVVGRTEADVTQTFALRNTAPTGGLPGYVLGYSRPGALSALMTMAVPEGAALRSFTRNGRRLAVATQAQTDHAVVTDAVEIASGTTTTWTLRYRLPVKDGRYALSAVPQPLAVDAGLSVRVRAGEGLILHRESASGTTTREVALSGPFRAPEQVAVVAAQPSRLSRFAAAVRRFWNEPVQLP